MCRRRPLLSTGVEIGDVTNYSRIQIQRIEYAEDVKGARVETGDIVTRWASTVTVDHMDRCAVFTSAGELSWVSPETEVTVVGPPSWAGQPEELVAEYPGDPNLPGLVGARTGWPRVIWHNRRRSEERRVGKECVRTCKYRWWPGH